MDYIGQWVIVLTNIVRLEVSVSPVGRLGSRRKRGSLDRGRSESSNNKSRCEHFVVLFRCCLSESV